jgi:predicted CopG family antitoxin
MKCGDEAEKYFTDNLNFPDFRRRAIDLAFKQKEYDKVIELAADGEMTEREWNKSGSVCEWKEWRYKAYTEKKDYEEIRKLSYDFLINHKDIKFYDMYKKTSDTASWEDTYKKLKYEIQKKSGNSFSDLLADILVKENELEVLLDILKMHPQSVSSYQKHFLKKHSEDIYKLHMINIRRAAKRADNRSKYQYVCADIKHLKKIGGKEHAVIIINEFKELYKHRPAFIDELTKI